MAPNSYGFLHDISDDAIFTLILDCQCYVCHDYHLFELAAWDPARWAIKQLVSPRPLQKRHHYQGILLVVSRHDFLINVCVDCLADWSSHGLLSFHLNYSRCPNDHLYRWHCIFPSSARLLPARSDLWACARLSRCRLLVLRIGRDLLQHALPCWRHYALNLRAAVCDETTRLLSKFQELYPGFHSLYANDAGIHKRVPNIRDE